jgi:hypothetical protein
MYKMYPCDKCNKKFQSEKKLQSHLKNILNPCDFVCKGCGFSAGSKGSFYRHKKDCKKHEELQLITNNVANNNVNAPTNNTQNIGNLNNNLNQSIVLLQPYKQDYEYTRKTDMFGPVRDIVLDLVKMGKFEEAYVTIFNQMWGNPHLPQHHNIYLPDINRDEVAVFKGRNFKLHDFEAESHDLYRILTHEMHRYVWYYEDINTFTCKEKNDLSAKIDQHWQTINEKNDSLLKRTLYNNKSLVKETFDKNVVKPDMKILMSEWGYRGQIPSEKPVENHLIKLI